MAAEKLPDKYKNECAVCGAKEKENLEHFLLRCSGSRRERNTLTTILNKSVGRTNPQVLTLEVLARYW